MSDYTENELNNEIIPDDQQEDENDLGAITSYKDAVIMNTDWTVETLNLQIKKGNIDLQPEFQRRSAWDNIRKSRLIESIVVGMPVPNIVIAENKKNRGRFIVIDGKQRLLSIRDFFNDQLVLKGLDIRSDLNGKRFSEFTDDDREYLENSTLRSSLIKNWKDDSFLYAIFFRLNSGSLPLSPQELRKALVGGKLIERIEDYLGKSESFKRVFGDTLDKRMRDSELVIRFIAFNNNYPEYDGNLKLFLDKTTNDYEITVGSGIDDLDNQFIELDRAIDTTFEIFGDATFKKWAGDKYERRINRAVFDCMVRFFANDLIAKLAISKKNQITLSYKELCLDPVFKGSIEKTTKSVEATRNRISLWGGSLASCIGVHFDPVTGRM